MKDATGIWSGSSGRKFRRSRMSDSNTKPVSDTSGNRAGALPDAPATMKRPGQTKPEQTKPAPCKEAPADGDTIAELGDAVGGPA
jgi:hypothetical protein